jgi:hypothetical protein
MKLSVYARIGAVKTIGPLWFKKTDNAASPA